MDGLPCCFPHGWIALLLGLARLAPTSGLLAGRHQHDAPCVSMVASCVGCRVVVGWLVAPSPSVCRRCTADGVDRGEPHICRASAAHLLLHICCTCTSAAHLPHICCTSAAHLPHICCTSAAHLPHICRTSAAHLLHICRISAAHLLHICCTSAALLPRFCHTSAAHLLHIYCTSAALQMAVTVESRKKAVMDKHLEQILGQTEKYSKMLASNLIRTGGGVHACVCVCA